MISQKAIEDITKIIFDKIKTELGLYKKDLIFETEAVLKNYGYIETMINKLRNEIENILKNGIAEIKINVKERVQGGLIEYNGNPEKEIKEIERIEDEILKLKRRALKVEAVLECVKKDKYYSIIEKRYFYNWIWEEISEEYNINIRTLRRQNDRLLRTISRLLFQEKNI